MLEEAIGKESQSLKKILHVTLTYRIYNLGIGLTEKVGIISINLIGVWVGTLMKSQLLKTK